MTRFEKSIAQTKDAALEIPSISKRNEADERAKNATTSWRWTLNALHENWLIAVLVLATTMALALLYLFIATPVYTATGQLIFDTRQPRIISDNPILQSLGGDQFLIDSQVEVLQSRAVIMKAIEEHALDKRFNPRRDGLGIANFLGVAGAAKSGMNPDKAKEELVDYLIKNVVVRRKGLSFVIEVSFSDSEPSRAAIVTNAVMQSYLAEQRRIKSEAVEVGNQWLVARVEEMRRRASEADQRVQAFRSEHNLVSDHSAESGSTTEEVEIAEYHRQLAVARATLAQVQARSQKVDELGEKPELLDAIPDAVDSKAIIELRRMYANLKSKQALATARYGEDHPQAQEATAELEKLKQLIEEEISRIIASTKVALGIAESQVRNLEAKIESVKRQMNESRQSSIGLAELEREAKVTSAIYASFLTRLKETESQETLQGPDARIVSLASVPTSQSRPKKSIVLILALGAGCTIGLFSAFGRAAFRRVFRTPNDIALWAGKPVLCSLLDPHSSECNQEQKVFSAAVYDNFSSKFLRSSSGIKQSKARDFHTSICMTLDAIENCPPATSNKVVSIVSPRDSEVSSSIAYALAHHAAILGYDVLLVSFRGVPGHWRSSESTTLSQSEPKRSAAIEWADLIREEPESKLRILALTCEDGRYNELPISGPNGIASFIAKISRKTHFVVIDTPAFLDCAASQLITRAATHAAVVVKLDDTAKADLSLATAGLASNEVHMIGFIAIQGKIASKEASRPLISWLWRTVNINRSHHQNA